MASNEEISRRVPYKQLRLKGTIYFDNLVGLGPGSWFVSVAIYYYFVDQHNLTLLDSVLQNLCLQKKHNIFHTKLILKIGQEYLKSSF